MRGNVRSMTLGLTMSAALAMTGACGEATAARSAPPPTFTDGGMEGEGGRVGSGCPLVAPEPGSACDAIRSPGTCNYASETASGRYADTRSCDPVAGQWSSGSTILERRCPEGLTTTVPLGSDDCSRRTAVACAEGLQRSAQELLDGAVNDVAASCLSENKLYVTFENGCPTSYSLSRLDDSTATCVAAALRAFRPSCGSGLTCGYATVSTAL
jgi:hypothetical protein